MSYTSIPKDPEVPTRAIYGIEELYRVHRFRSRQEYEEVTGEPCPEFDPTKDAKHWLDTSQRGKSKYATVTVLFAILEPGAGSPTTVEYPMPASFASTVNIHPLAGVQVGVVPGEEITETPVPIRALLDSEALWTGTGGTIMVRNTDYEDAPAAGGYGESDRKLLRAIAAKLGATV